MNTKTPETNPYDVSGITQLGIMPDPAIAIKTIAYVQPLKATEGKTQRRTIQFRSK